MTKIIAAFPGTGKTYITNNTRINCSDSDSSNFSWVKDENGNNTKERNPEFPQNYINHIKELDGQVDIIFVSSHEVVRDALVDNNLEFNLVYPNRSMKEEMIERYIQRGSPEGFINLIRNNWDNWINDCENQIGCTKVELSSNQYLLDVI